MYRTRKAEESLGELKKKRKTSKNRLKQEKKEFDWMLFFKTTFVILLKHAFAEAKANSA